MSPSAKSLVASLDVNVRAILGSEVVLPLVTPDVLDEIVIVGEVVSLNNTYAGLTEY